MLKSHIRTGWLSPLAGGAGVEPFTKLLIHGDSINGATGKTVTANGNA